MRAERLVPALLVLTLAGACVDAGPASVAAPERGGDAAAIVGGQPTGTSLYPSVGALLFDYDQNGVIDGDDEFCTGSLISPTVFLTAAHCVVSADTPPGSQWWVSFAPDLYAKGIKPIKATGYVWDPQYAQGGTSQLHDLALIFLPENATKGMTPLSLPPAGYLEALAAKGKLSKATFVNVGYGVDATRHGKTTYPYDGVRKYSFAMFSSLQPTWLNLSINTSVTGEGGDCYGDSGGPKFLQDHPTMVLATVTTGDANCRATTKDWRLDTREARDFLGAYVKLP